MLSGLAFLTALTNGLSADHSRLIQTDVCVYGGTSGGVVAAPAAQRVLARYFEKRLPDYGPELHPLEDPASADGLEASAEANGGDVVRN